LYAYDSVNSARKPIMHYLVWYNRSRPHSKSGKKTSDEAYAVMLPLALKDVEEKGPDILSPWKTGTLALPRLHEVAAATNRMRVEG
jgi:hypothetical protein